MILRRVIETLASIFVVEPEQKFQNIPERLTNYIKNSPPSLWEKDRNLLYLLAANGIIAEYLNRSFLSDEASEFYCQHELVGENLSFVQLLRSIRLGEALFLMRNAEGFSEICRRLKTQANRDMRAVFYEVIAAKHLFLAGYEIKAKPETGIKGQDFDFYVTRKSLGPINVEVTALEERPFSATTIRNALENKRKQLPSDLPSIVYCILPQSWEGDSTIDLNDHTVKEVIALFERSQRINAVVFVMDRQFKFDQEGATGGYIVVVQPHFHTNPRLYIPNLQDIYEGVALSPLNEAITNNPRDYAEHTETLKIATKEFQTNEFYEWVDYLHPYLQDRGGYQPTAFSRGSH